MKQHAVRTEAKDGEEGGWREKKETAVHRHSMGPVRKRRTRVAAPISATGGGAPHMDGWRGPQLRSPVTPRRGSPPSPGGTEGQGTHCGRSASCPLRSSPQVTAPIYNKVTGNRGRQCDSMFSLRRDHGWATAPRACKVTTSMEQHFPVMSIRTYCNVHVCTVLAP